RLILRQWRDSDLDGFAAMMSHRDVARFLTADGRPLDRTAAWRQMALYAGHWPLKGYGLFVLEEKETGAFVGRAGCWQPEGWYGFEIGWGLDPRVWGKGYATEAARAAANWAFVTFNLERVVSVIHVDNERSKGVARRMGMSRGVRTIHAGMPHDVWFVTRARFVPRL
ncbi:MAG: GNAT family N-acetyltransferase, partial [Caulobacterales bacterium]